MSEKRARAYRRDLARVVGPELYQRLEQVGERILLLGKAVSIAAGGIEQMQARHDDLAARVTALEHKLDQRVTLT